MMHRAYFVSVLIMSLFMKISPKHSLPNSSFMNQNVFATLDDNMFRL